MRIKGGRICLGTNRICQITRHISQAILYLSNESELTPSSLIKFFKNLKLKITFFSLAIVCNPCRADNFTGLNNLTGLLKKKPNAPNKALVIAA